MCVRCLELSRRSLLVGGGRPRPRSTPASPRRASARRTWSRWSVPASSRPNATRMGLWKEMDRVEEEIAGSNLLINDPKLTGYLKDIIGKVGGPAAKDFRIYLARIPDFNAMMFPSGFAVVFSGLLLRMRNEAQLAGVIAHESGHFLRRHMIRSWRDKRRKTDIFAIGAMLAGVGGAGPASTSAIMSSSPSSAPCCRCSSTAARWRPKPTRWARSSSPQTGYPPIEMANIWEQLIGEENASARYRGKHRRRGSPVRYPPVRRTRAWRI